MTLIVTGYATSIVYELGELVPDDPFVRMGIELARPDVNLASMPRGERYLLAAGVLHQKPILEQTWSEMIESLSVNAINVIRICETILERQADARICVVGSESASRGSFDLTYAAGKAAVHAYVKARKTKPQQQLVCVSPTIIADSGMTSRRKDYPAVLEERETVTAIEVARVIHRVLYKHPPDTLTGCVIPVTSRTANGKETATDNPH